MATREEKCRRCKTKFLVAIDARIASCPVCRNPARVASGITNLMPLRQALPNINQIQGFEGLQQGPAEPRAMGMGVRQRPAAPPVMGTGMRQRPAASPAMGMGLRQRPAAPPVIGTGLQQRPAAPPTMGMGLQQRPAAPPAMGMGLKQLQAAPPTMGAGLQQGPAALPAMGRKRAVLCGITYKGNPKSLPGSINDVMCMKNFLMNKLGFKKSSIKLLTEDETDPSKIPTKKNIRKALRWLVKECQPGDSLVFHYSGHGSKVRDTNGDEVDGHDEALCPVDYETEGRMLDDEINETIVRPLPHGVTLHAIIDTCFSGTFLDIPYICRMNMAGNFMWEDHSVRHTYKGSTGGTAISISACDDHQTSGDTTAFSGKANGALTYSFIKTLENQPNMTYGQLLITMRKEIHGTQVAVVGPNAHIQEPQLSATSRFDIHTKNVTL